MLYFRPVFYCFLWCSLSFHSFFLFWLFIKMQYCQYLYFLPYSLYDGRLGKERKNRVFTFLINMRICIFFFCVFFLAWCSQQQSYECKGWDRECLSILNQSMIKAMESDWVANDQRMAWLSEKLTWSIAETCQFPNIERLYDARTIDEKARGQYIIWCNEYNVRLQHSFELFNKIETLK